MRRCGIRASVRRKPRTRRSVGRAAAGNVVVRGGLVTRGAGIDGAFLLEAVGINVGIRIRAGDLTLAPFRSDAWLSAEMVSLRLAAR